MEGAGPVEAAALPTVALTKKGAVRSYVLTVGSDVNRPFIIYAVLFVCMNAYA